MVEHQGHDQAGTGSLSDTLGTWAELNERVGQDLLRVTSGAIEESVRASSEMQQAAVAAWREAQSAALRWQTLWIDLGRRNTETAMRSFDRLQRQSEQAARTLEDTLRDSASKIRDIQSGTESARVA